MTLKQAAQAAIEVQNACNSCGIANSLSDIMRDVLMVEGKGTRYVNTHPIVALFLFKLGELNGYGISSLDEGYDRAMNECLAIVNPPVSKLEADRQVGAT